MIRRLGAAAASFSILSLGFSVPRLMRSSVRPRFSSSLTWAIWTSSRVKVGAHRNARMPTSLGCLLSLFRLSTKSGFPTSRLPTRPR